MAKGTGSHPTDVESSWAKSKVPVAHTVDALRTVFTATRDETVDQAEIRYLTGKTGVTSKNRADMWREAVAGLGVIPKATIQENRELYFRSVV